MPSDSDDISDDSGSRDDYEPPKTRAAARRSDAAAPPAVDPDLPGPSSGAAPSSDRSVGATPPSAKKRRSLGGRMFARALGALGASALADAALGPESPSPPGPPADKSAFMAAIGVTATTAAVVTTDAVVTTTVADTAAAASTSTSGAAHRRLAREPSPPVGPIDKNAFFVRDPDVVDPPPRVPTSTNGDDPPPRVPTPPPRVPTPPLLPGEEETPAATVEEEEETAPADTTIHSVLRRSSRRRKAVGDLPGEEEETPAALVETTVAERVRKTPRRRKSASVTVVASSLERPGADAPRRTSDVGTGMDDQPKTFYTYLVRFSVSGGMNPGGFAFVPRREAEEIAENFQLVPVPSPPANELTELQRWRVIPCDLMDGTKRDMRVFAVMDDDARLTDLQVRYSRSWVN
mgnify:CR=1 FL=1